MQWIEEVLAFPALCHIFILIFYSQQLITAVQEHHFGNGKN